MIRFILSTLIILFLNKGLYGQKKAIRIDQLVKNYPEYKENTIDQRQFSVNDLRPIFEKLSHQKEIIFNKKASSIEGRPIYMGEYGNGDKRILFWSQMHGNESTATMALLDFFNWLSDTNSNYQGFLNEIKTNFTLYFIPMLNPDGAEKFVRRNAANIDINRDALDLSSPESRFLKKVRDSLQPDLAFSLHDQSIFNRAGLKGKQSVITFLAPAFNDEKEVNLTRLKTMQIISVLNDSLSQIVPERISRYDDTFERRAFGDNFTKWGTPYILIESGGYPNDPEKQFIRKLNYITFIKSLETLLDRSFKKKTLEDYESIPENHRSLISMKIKNIKRYIGDHKIIFDLGYIYNEIYQDGQLAGMNARINDVGDLSTYEGFEEFDAKDYRLIQPKWYTKKITSIDQLRNLDWKKLITEGYLGLVLTKPFELPEDFPLPTSYTRPPQEKDPFNLTFSPGTNPIFMLEKENEIFIIINGKLHTMRNFIDEIASRLRTI